VRPSGDVRDDGDGCDGAHGDAPADRDDDRPPKAGRSYSCPPTQSTVSSSHSAAPKLNKSRRDIRPREGRRQSFSPNPRCTSMGSEPVGSALLTGEIKFGRGLREPNSIRVLCVVRLSQCSDLM